MSEAKPEGEHPADDILDFGDQRIRVVSTTLADSSHSHHMN